MDPSTLTLPKLHTTMLSGFPLGSYPMRPYGGPLPVDLAALPVAIYARLSRNPDGTKDSVETQVEIGVREAAARWPGRPYLVFTDDDISAGDDDHGRNPEELRPGYADLCDAIRRGQVGDVLCRWQSRISRGEAVWPHWKSVCLLAGITTLHTWLEGEIDLSPGGGLAGNIRNMFNVEMRVKTRMAVKDTLDHNASVGKPPGGHRYGYRSGREGRDATLEVIPEQAETLRRMAEWILSGESQSDIARWLNAEGNLTGTGAPWRAAKVREVLCNPIVAGFRTHQIAKATAARGPDAKRHPYDGIVGRGTWEPIIAEDRWRLLVAHFTTDRTVKAKTGEIVKVQAARGTARDYLLSGGLIRCGKCGARLYSARYVSRQGKHLPSYRCLTTEGGCGGTSISAPQTEAWLVTEALRWLSGEDAIRKLMEEADDDAELRAEINERRKALEIQREELSDRAVAEGMSIAMATTMDRKIGEALAELARREAGLSVVKAVIDYEAIVASWDELTFGERRAALFAIGTLVTVGPAKGGVTPPESRLSADFRVEPAPRERTKPRRSKRATKTT